MIDLARDRIARLRWRGGGDALAARQAAERALAAVVWGPRGSGILCVRRLRGTLRAGGSPGPWRDRMEALAASAARPWREPVPAQAQAVVFADEAELLACLARDAAQDRAALAWWWPALLGAPADRAAVLQLWRQDPTPVPLALRHLARGDALRGVLDFFGDGEVRELTRQVARAFAVDLVRSPAEWPDPPAGRQSTGVPASLHPQWAALMQEVRAVLGGGPSAPQAMRLLAVALAVLQYPRLVRMGGFGETLEALLAKTLAAAPQAARKTPVADLAPLRVLREPTSVSHDTVSTRHEHAPPMLRDAGGVATPERAAATGALAPPETTTGRLAPVPVPGAAGTHQDEPVLASATPPIVARPRAAVPRPATGPASPAPDAAWDALRVRSAFAGTLYLLPIAVHLGWYADFTQPRTRGLALHPADLLSLLGERCAGDGWTHDGLPALLTHWAGRALDEPAGLGLVPDGGIPLAQWLAERTAAMAARASAALDVPQAEVLPWLVRREGLVTLDDLRLDAYFDLATHPLAIRLAGLDRDVGWLPAAGRSIAFHFDLGLPA